MAARHGGRGGRSAGRGREAVRRPEVVLPPLRAFDGPGLEPEGDYDGLEFADLDLGGQHGPGARFLDCALRRAGLDEAGLSRARFIDSVLVEVRGVGADLSGATLRDVELRDARLGGIQLHGARLERVLVRGGKLDYLNLRSAALRDVVFEDCVLVEPDFGGAHLERVAFPGCELRGADFSGARMSGADLREAARVDIARGVDALAGALITPDQLLELAPVFAAHLGVRVEPT
ncbi:pentapeptide repeat-containing protein [Streptomyces palmae]|uniref:Pentapeptide repeat-containing protein n=1 Tax=Streptomyces palmae TaxID=1701085 RepID=A0A4Z0HE00_9ACTN|nr:pentapeptide repeat-containing protein [Streptomyces palmae]TGB12078.1 pentapeptide repeat-containing protein [Streptomyces palmae]